MLMEMIPFKKPQFALLDQITLSLQKVDDSEGDEQQKLWVYMDFVKAGRHTFCVNQK